MANPKLAPGRRPRTPYGWLGAGALGMGVWAALAGGAGVAHADSTDSTSSVADQVSRGASASANSGIAQRPTAAAASRSARQTPARDSRSAEARSGRAVIGQQAASTTGTVSPSPAAATAALPSAGRTRTGVSDVAPVAARRVTNSAPPAELAVVAPAIPAAVSTGLGSGVGSLPSSSFRELSSGTPRLARRELFGNAPSAYQAIVAAASADGIATAPPSQATIAVSNWFSGNWGFLTSLNNPLADAVAQALVGLQRTFFSPTPTVKPVQLTTWAPGDSILGELRYVQPGGAPVTFTLTQAPALGTVQLLADGNYTYDPGANFTGTDSFTASVTAGGFNILEPFAPRTESVTVAINPSPPVTATKGFSILNATDYNAILTNLQVEPGYEDSVDISNGGYIGAGDETRIEMTFWAFYGYQTNFNWKGECDYVVCFPQETAWTVGIKLNPPSLDTRWEASCITRNCSIPRRFFIRLEERDQKNTTLSPPPENVAVISRPAVFTIDDYIW